MSDFPDPVMLSTETAFQAAVSNLTDALQDTIHTTVPHIRPSPHSKRWWSNELTSLKGKKNKLSNMSYKYRALPSHPVHEEHRAIRRLYSEAITTAKREHWASFLEGLSYGEVWTANRYISNEVTDGSKTRIPTLTLQSADPSVPPVVASTNEEKSVMLAGLMFPAKPSSCAVAATEYEDQLPTPQRITEDQIRRHIAHLSPYKAPGADEIPNVVLKMCAELITPYLLQIFQAALELRVYADQWRDITTCVLRKPGKPRYDIPKAYRPIALVNTIAKLFSAIVAEDIIHLTETYQLLPAHHFGGRPGRTTTDSLHLLVDTIKAAWRRKQVVSVLFLDIEGAFPNAVTERLLHNLRTRRIPETYVQLIYHMLTGRRNRLKFDDYTSEWFNLDNGIVQGNPLSMVLYLFYNADMIDIPRGRSEMCLGYVDDTALVAAASSFTGTHRILKSMMVHRNGGYDWSVAHNSKFEASKSVLIDFSRNKNLDRPHMTLRGTAITPQTSHKFLGVMLDQELRWREQADYALSKAAKWTLAFRRLARPTSGVNLRLMRQMYSAVAIPKVVYAADVWYTPTRKKEGASRLSGSVGITNKLASIQRMAAIAITGAMRTTATDILDLHAGLTPIPLMLHRICHRATLRLASLPETHPLHSVFRTRAKRYIKTHRSPLHELASIYDIAPGNIEPTSPVRSPPAYVLKAKVPKLPVSEEAEEEEQIGEDVVQVFSDGSGLDGQVGAAAVMYRTGRGPRVLRYHLGPLTDHTVFEAEAVGLLLALHMLKYECDAPRAIVRLDNQAVLGALHIRKPSPAQAIIDEIIAQMERNWAGASNPAYTLDITWVRGHSGVEGNERVDREAKEAAKGRSSQKRNLPKFLTKAPLPKSISAQRQEFNAGLIRRWKLEWEKSPRHARISRIDPTMPSNGFRKLMAGLSRSQASIIMQLRTGHVLLRKHLSQICKVDTVTCLHCQQDEESVHHYLFECAAWRHERWHMGWSLGRKAKSADCTLNTQKGVKEVIRFVGRTARFKSVFGEIPQPAPD